jgi:hypothetical protein
MATKIPVIMEVTEPDLAIPEASTIPMAPTTQHAPAITIASVISVASDIPMDVAIPEGIPFDLAISAVSSAIPEAILVHSAIPVPSAIPISTAIPEASAVPPRKSPHFTPAAPTVLTPTAPRPVSIPKQTMVSPTWIEDQLRYTATMTPPATLITLEVEPIFLHVS